MKTFVVNKCSEDMRKRIASTVYDVERGSSQHFCRQFQKFQIYRIQVSNVVTGDVIAFSHITSERTWNSLYIVCYRNRGND